MIIPFDEKLKIVAGHIRGKPSPTIEQLLEVLTAGPEVSMDWTAVAICAVRLFVHGQRLQRKLDRVQARAEAERLRNAAWEKQLRVNVSDYVTYKYKQRAEIAETALQVLLPKVDLGDQGREIVKILRDARRGIFR